MRGIRRPSRPIEIVTDIRVNRSASAREPHPRKPQEWGDRRGLQSGSLIERRKRGRGGLRAWRRPTLPHLGVQYHRRGGFSRPSSGWDRVFGPSLWPPGRQSRAPERPRSRAAVRGFVRGLSCAGGSVFVRPLGPRGRGERGSCRYARRRRVQAPIERLVPVSCAGCPASTSGLSTWWSTTALKRDLVLRRVSRLDAFSGYPVRT